MKVIKATKKFANTWSIEFGYFETHYARKSIGRNLKEALDNFYFQNMEQAEAVLEFATKEELLPLPKLDQFITEAQNRLSKKADKKIEDDNKKISLQPEDNYWPPSVFKSMYKMEKEDPERLKKNLDFTGDHKQYKTQRAIYLKKGIIK